MPSERRSYPIHSWMWKGRHGNVSLPPYQQLIGMHSAKVQGEGVFSRWQGGLLLLTNTVCSPFSSAGACSVNMTCAVACQARFVLSMREKLRPVLRNWYVCFDVIDLALSFTFLGTGLTFEV